MEEVLIQEDLINGKWYWSLLDLKLIYGPYDSFEDAHEAYRRARNKDCPTCED